MADNIPVIRVLGFNTTYEMHPKRGTNPLNDTTDDRGFLLDEKGKRIMERIAEDWVSYSPAHSPIGTKNVERIRHMIPDPARVGNDPDGAKLAFMAARWAQIEPAYELWKSGQEIPLNGTPLEVCPLFNTGMIEVLHQVGIKTVEEVRDLSELHLMKVALPNMRDLKKQAGIFIDNMGGAAAAEREAEKDAQLVAMSERLAQMEAALATQNAAQAAAQDAAPDEEVAELRAQLDAKGVQYDKRWAAPKLRQALAGEAA
jgi:hypothetical protein